MTEFLTGSAQQTRLLGEQLGARLRAGDLVLLHGGLGAGKTTFTQGLAAGLQVEGRVTSPTFIVARTHRSEGEGPDLIHVDAYRIEDDLDLETLDLDSSLEQSVTVVEWGAGKVEALSPNRLEITLESRGEGSDWETAAGEPRRITMEPHGDTWSARLAALLADAAPQASHQEEN